MRSFVIATASVIALVAIALALTRLGATVAQLRELDAPLFPGFAPTTGQAAAEHVPREAVQLELDALASELPGTFAAAANESHGAADSDVHIMRWLAEAPEFQRAAEELQQDPDPHVRAEVQRLLRDLGAMTASD